MIGAGDIVTVEGEGEGLWEVDMAGDGSPMVRLIQNKDASTWRMVDRVLLNCIEWIDRQQLSATRSFTKCARSLTQLKNPTCQGGVVIVRGRNLYAHPSAGG
jgi:hypothetical protein